jgi:hypothetical protein
MAMTVLADKMSWRYAVGIGSEQNVVYVRLAAGLLFVWLRHVNRSLFPGFDGRRLLSSWRAVGIRHTKLMRMV